jgi:hypothetical protein
MSEGDGSNRLDLPSELSNSANESAIPLQEPVELPLSTDSVSNRPISPPPDFSVQTSFAEVLANPEPSAYTPTERVREENGVFEPGLRQEREFVADPQTFVAQDDRETEEFVQTNISVGEPGFGGNAQPEIVEYREDPQTFVAQDDR